MSGILTFDPNSHHYLLDGKAVPSVTQVMQSAGIIEYGWLPPDERERLMACGRAVHAATQYDDEGDLDETTLSAEIGGYLEGWRKFRRDAQFVPSLIEYLGYHKKFRFAGRLDRTGSIQGTNGILADIKTGEAQWWTAVQLAAYASFFDHPGAYRRLSVELHVAGTYRLQEFRCADYQRDFNIFSAALVVHNSKTQFGGNK